MSRIRNKIELYLIKHHAYLYDNECVGTEGRDRIDPLKGFFKVNVTILLCTRTKKFVIMYK